MLQRKRKLQLGKAERNAMRQAGQFNAYLMDYIRPFIQAGITTREIDKLVYDETLKHKHTPAQLGYQGFPCSSCTSVNEVICHGIPSDYELVDGDIVNVDLTTIVDGWYGDQSETFLIGDVDDEGRAVAQCSLDCMFAGIDAIKPGGRISDIGDAIVAVAHGRGFSVVREYVGHGVGRRFHQEPSIPHYPTRQSRQERIQAGMTFTVEPMINVGARETELDKSDGWTVRTRDRKRSAQFEHTVLVTEEGPELLTETKHGPKKGDQL